MPEPIGYVVVDANRELWSECMFFDAESAAQRAHDADLDSPRRLTPHRVCAVIPLVPVGDGETS